MLAARLTELGPDWNYPLHLGVTEAGDGEDGRIKSAIGIGALLADGLGDTIRVSLTEDSVHEIPVARALVALAKGHAKDQLPPQQPPLSFDPFVFNRRASEVIEVDPNDSKALDFLANARGHHFVTIKDGCTLSPIVAFRYLAAQIPAKHPILLKDTFHPPEPGEKPDVLDTMLSAASNIGALLCDGIGDAILVRGEPGPGASIRLAFNILQSVGNRIFKTDYVACPSCGRTLFNLQTTTAKIREATNHLKGVKIAIMGCIVNGPGEMADADFGYVGGAPGKVNLYIGKTPVKFNIPEGEAVNRLVDLIKENGKWFDAPVPVAAS